MSGYILAIDQGTTGSTCLIIDESGQVRARAYSEFTQHYPRPGWVEHDPDEIWRTPVQYDDIRGRWTLMKDILLRRKREAEFPSIIEIMSRSMVVASRMASKEMLSEQDILVNPPIIPGMQILDWHMGRELSQMAADYITREVIESAGLRDLA